MSIDLSSIDHTIESLSLGTLDTAAIQKLRENISKQVNELGCLNTQTVFLTRLATKLFSNSSSQICYDLLLYTTSKAQADIWLGVLISRLKQIDLGYTELQLCLGLFSKYFLEFQRLRDLFVIINDLSHRLSDSARYAFLVEKIRRLVNLPTFIENSGKSVTLPRLFKPEVYFPFLIRHAFVFNDTLLSGIIISQSCLVGFGAVIWKAILMQVSRSDEGSRVWSGALSQVQERALEATLVPLLKQASHPHLVTLCLSSALRSMEDQMFRLFYRLLIFRKLSPRVPVNIFGFLREIATDHLNIRVEKELGICLLQCWSDSKSLQGTSSQNRIYLNQALVAWVGAFQNAIINSPSYADMITYVLRGISAHLACNIDEQRVLGMAVGEWLVERFCIGVKPKSDGEKDENSRILKFEYAENEATKLVKPLFEPIPLYRTCGTQVDKCIERLFTNSTDTRSPLNIIAKSTSNLDSDDDPDETEFARNFRPLPTYIAPAPSCWPFRSRRPHYLRECLDGLSGTKNGPDDVASNEIALSCFAHAEELIYRHKGDAVDEVAIAFADALLHTEPPVSPHTTDMNTARHRALVALAVVSPRRTARYLTGQLIKSGLAVNQFLMVIAALTDAAFALGPKFVSVVGDFFFPTLRAAENLVRCERDSYIYLDDVVLARIVSSLGTMYGHACHSTMLPRMAEGLLSLGATILSKAHDPVVRRSFLSALSVLLTTTPAALFATHQQVFLDDKLTSKLLKTLQDDPDIDCKKMAGIALSFIRERLVGMIGVDFNAMETRNMECDVPNEVMLEPEIPKDVRTSEFFMFNEGPDVLMCSQPTVHAEIRLTRGCTASRDTIYRAVEAYLRARQGTCTLPTLLEPSLLSDLPSAAERTFFTENIASISLSTDDTDCLINREPISQAVVHLQTVSLVFHVYRLISGDEADPTHETLEIASEVIRGGTRWALPSAVFDGLWDSLVYDSNIKKDLLKYSESALLFADRKVNQHVIAWNRVIFLHGPPGTGKTSLCHALAHKLSIRLSHRFTSAALIEVSSINLMSKWFSESARLVSQMFLSIFEYLEDPDHLVFLLVDEVESLTAMRKSVASSCEPSDALRVVNAVLTHLDQLKHYPNVLVMATSNVTDVVDPAFLDRADIRAYIGPPSAVAIYSIYVSCLNELTRVGLIERQKSGLLNYRVLSALKFAESPVTSSSLAVWRLAQRSIGLNGRTLRKLPLLAHAFHVDSKYHSRHPALYSIGRCSGDCEEKENSPPLSSIALPLKVFLEALKQAIDSRFSDQRLTIESHSRMRAISKEDEYGGSCPNGSTKGTSFITANPQ